MKSSLFLKIFTLSGFLILISTFVAYRAGFFTDEEMDNEKDGIETKFSADEMTEEEEIDMMSSSKDAILLTDEDLELIPSTKSADILDEEIFTSKAEEEPKKISMEIKRLNELQIISSSKSLILTDDFLRKTHPLSIRKPLESQTALPVRPVSFISREK